MLTPIALKRTDMHGHASSECHQPRLPDGDRRSFDTADSVRGKKHEWQTCFAQSAKNTDAFTHILLQACAFDLHTGAYTHTHRSLHAPKNLDTQGFTLKIA